LHGWITHAEYVGDTFRLRLAFESLDFDNDHVDLRGRLIRCSVADDMAPNSKFRGETEQNPRVFSANHLRFPWGFQFSLKKRNGQSESVLHATGPASPVSKAALPERPATQKPPQPAPVLRTETVAIVVDAIVTDRKGRHGPMAHPGIAGNRPSVAFGRIVAAAEIFERRVDSRGRRTRRAALTSGSPRTGQDTTASILPQECHYQQRQEHHAFLTFAL